VRAQAAEVTAAQASLRGITTSLTDAQSQLLPMQYELTRATREKDLLVERLEAAEVELNEKNDELATLRRDHSAAILELGDKYSTAQTELQSKDDRAKALQVCQNRHPFICIL
jgi:predicted nuclease with TOPRIM domain